MNSETIKKLHRRYRVPEHIRSHMQKVAEVAVFIARKINQKKRKRIVKINMVRNAALLHDILKICEFKKTDRIFKDTKYDSRTKRIWISLINRYQSMGHIRAAESLMIDLKEPVLAEIIRKHDHSCPVSSNPRLRPQTFEEKILYYADKRVLHDTVVSMEYRFKEGRQRYLGHSKVSRTEAKIIKKAGQLEKEICEAAGIRPEDIC